MFVVCLSRILGNLVRSALRGLGDTNVPRLPGMTQQAGFTLNEIRLLVNEILPGTAQPHWQDVVQRKLEELNILLAQVATMKSLLEDVMRCEDPTLADCIYIAGQKHKVGHGAK